MAAFNYVILLCLLCIGLSSATDCKRECGDQLLDTIPMLSVVIGGPARADKSYPGYRITCTKCYSILGSLGEAVNLNVSVLKGGRGCDNVLLEVNLSSLLGYCEVYGKKLKDGEVATCNN